MPDLHPHQAAAVRVERVDGAVLGSGFLVDERHVVTCGHLFGDGEREARVRFLCEPHDAWPVRVDPLDEGDATDLAVLELLQGRPAGSRAIPLRPFEAERRFLAQGYPAKHEQGSTVRGTISLPNLHGWVQLEAEGGRRVEPGFSGAAVWSETQNAAVGMVVARDEDAVAYMIPVSELKAAWSGLPVEPSPYRNMAEVPEGYVPRTEYAAILEHLAQQRGGTAAITTALRGAGGFGKTTLAQALCQDVALQGAFPDGILWTVFGEAVTSDGRLSCVRDLIRWWTGEEPPAFETLHAAGADLRRHLSGRRVLVVADDVWDPADLASLRNLPEGCALLVTTRDSRNLPTDCERFEVDAMASDEARALLTAGVPGLGLSRIDPLAATLGRWPLLLKLVNRQLRERIDEEGLEPLAALSEIEDELEAEGLTAFDRTDTEARDRAVSLTLNVSLNRLAGEVRDRFVQLAVFPEDAEVPVEVVAALWGEDVPTARRRCRALHQLSLLRDFHRGNDTIRLHDVVRKYLLQLAGDQLPSLHRRLVERLRPPQGGWPDLPPTPLYPWHHLVYHLSAASRSGEVTGLLTDYRWLAAKLAATDVLALRRDFSPKWAAAGTERDTEVQRIGRALRLSSNALSKDESQLASQLSGRLSPRHGHRTRRLLDLAATAQPAPWLRFVRPTLSSPDSALLQIFEGHTQAVTAVDVLPDGRLVSACKGGTLRIWDPDSGETLVTLKVGYGTVFAIVVLPDGRLVSSTEDCALRVWNPDSGKCLATLVGHCDSALALTLLPDGRFVSASKDGTLRVWSPDSEEALVTLKGHSYQVNAAAVLPDGRLVSAGGDSKLRFWNPDSGEALGAFQGTAEALAVLPDGRLVCGGFGLQLRDSDSGETLSTLEGHARCITGVVVLADGRLASCSDDRTLRIWNPDSGETLVTLEGHTGGINAVGVLPDGRLVSASDDGTVRLWNTDSGETLAAVEKHGDRVTAIAVLPDGRLVSGSEDRTLRLWNLDSGETLATRHAPCDSVNAIAVLPDGRLVSCNDSILCLWNLDSEEGFSLEGRGKLTAIAVLPDGSVVAGYNNGSLRLLNPDSGRTLAWLEGHRVSIRALAVLRDGRLISVDRDSILLVWNPDSGKVLAAQRLPIGLTAIAILPGGLLVAASRDQAVRLLSSDSGRCLAITHLDSVPSALAWSSVHNLVVVGDVGGAIHSFQIEEPSVQIRAADPRKRTETIR